MYSRFLHNVLSAASDHACRFQYYYIFKGQSGCNLPPKYVEEDQADMHNETTNSEENESLELNRENNPDIAEALVSVEDAQWKQCHGDLRNLFQNESDTDNVIDKIWTMENVLMSSSQNGLPNSLLALELCYIFTVKHMGKDRGTIEDEFKVRMMEEAETQMLQSGFFPNAESMKQDPDFQKAMESILPSVISHVPDIENYESIVTDINDLQKQALKKIHHSVVDIIDNHGDNAIDKESELMKLLLANNDEYKHHTSTGSEASLCTLEYLFLILRDYIVQSTMEVKRLVCCIIAKCMTNDSFLLLREALKTKGIGSCKGAFLYLNLAPKQDFPPLNKILNYIKKNCHTIEDLPADTQMKLSQYLKEEINSSEPSVLKETLSFLKSIPAHLLVDDGVISRCIDLLAGKGVSSTALTEIKSRDYYSRKITVSKNDVSIKALDLLYNVALDGEYATAVIEEADKNLATIKNYLSHHVGSEVRDKSEFFTKLV